MAALIAVVWLTLLATSCSSSSETSDAVAAAATASEDESVSAVETTTTTPSTSTPPSTSTSTSSIATTTTETTTTTEPPPPTFPKGDAGSTGSIGCTGDCPVLGEQDLDGLSDVLIENVVISNPTGRCVTMRGASNIVLRNVTITDCATTEGVWGDGYDTGLILIEDSENITIENSVITRMAAEDSGAARNNAFQIVDTKNVRIVNNEISDVFSDIERKAGDQGNRSISVQGSNTGNITIESNTFRNAGRGALQIVRARDLAGVSFTKNVVEGRGPWDSDYEDMVNLFSSSGRPDDPIVISDNYMRNGGPSVSGTALFLGDGAVSDGHTAHVVAENNVIVNPGHVGIVLGGGHDIVVRDNLIFGDADVSHPTTVGMAINDYGFTGTCRDNLVTGNRVFLRNQMLDSGVNHVWNSGTCAGSVIVEGNAFGDESLNASLWRP